MQNLLFASVLQLCMAALALAAPIADDITAQETDTWQYGASGGIIVDVTKSDRPAVHKLLWSLLDFLFPLGGPAIYWLCSNRAAHNNSGGYEALP
ncbi:hypothetical protein OQA88_8001 [Cercophora sp. LCS_1]